MKSRKNNPPKIASWILSKLKYYEENFALTDAIEQDYFEYYSHKGKIKSWLWYWFQTLEILNHFILVSLVWSIIRLKYNIKVMFRNLFKHKGYSFINILGLVLGMACSVLILIFVQFELSYDQFHQNRDRIHRAVINVKFGNIEDESAFSPAILTQTLYQDYPDVEISIRLRPWSRGVPVAKENKTFNEHRVAASDLLAGEDPIGKTITPGSDIPFRVIGVVQDFHYESLHHKVRPAVLASLNGAWNWWPEQYISLRVETQDLPGTVDYIQSSWDRFNRGEPLEYTFLDDDFAALYDNEQRTGKLFSVSLVWPLMRQDSAPKRSAFVRFWAHRCPVSLCSFPGDLLNGSLSQI